MFAFDRSPCVEWCYCTHVHDFCFAGDVLRSTRWEVTVSARFPSFHWFGKQKKRSTCVWRKRTCIEIARKLKRRCSSEAFRLSWLLQIRTACKFVFLRLHSVFCCVRAFRSQQNSWDYLFSHPMTIIVHRVIFFSAEDHLRSVFSASVEIRYSLDSLF